jgi:hypothetical protein
MCSKTMERAIPELDQAYAHLTPIFFGALGRLARQGFVVSPADSMDLIHDFFVDAWASVSEHFDPNKGSFDGYAYGAFVRFARPRIIRLQRWQHSLVGPEQLDTYMNTASAIVSDPDDEKVRQAISLVPQAEQEILRGYVYNDSASERSLAREFHLTRYRLREILVNALGRVAVSLDRPAAIARLDWDVARSLWRDCRTIQETATYLSLTPEQVRRANTRNVLFLREILKHYQGRRVSEKGREDMFGQHSATTMATSSMDILKRALETPNEEGLLREVQIKAKEILRQMASADLQAPDLDVERLSAEWVARVYQALFEGAAPESQETFDTEAVQELFSVHGKKDVAIGEAFRSLVAGLPASLCQASLFSDLPHIPRDEERLLRQAPDVQASWSDCASFLPYGIRPLKVFYATQAVAGLGQRLLELKFIDKSQLILGEEIRFVDDKGQPQNLEDLMVMEIRQTSEIDARTSKALYSWMIQAAQYRPYIFKGFRVQLRPRSPSVGLVTDSNEAATGDVTRRWAIQEVAAQTYVATRQRSV